MGASLVAGIAGALATSSAPYPRPGSSPEQIRAFFRDNRAAARLSVTGQAISALALARFTGSVAGLARRSGEGSGPVAALAIAGGTVATACLGYSAVCSARLTGDEIEDDARARLLHRRGFQAGGPGHGVGFGMLMAALGLAGKRSGGLSERLANAALVSAGANLLSPLYFVAAWGAWFIPAGRFSGLAVSAISGVQLASESA